jgi:uncharacterized protein (TIGR02145 family)
MSNSTVQYGSKGIIGTQRWMTRNLEVTHYRNGDLIPEVQDQTTWNNLTTGAWCYYNNDPALGAIYGKLYNWYAVNDARGLAPQGWHIPSVFSEVQTLSNFLGGATVAGGKLKATGTTYWNSPNTGATNSSRFNALGSGFRGTDGTFTGINSFTRFWSSSPNADGVNAFAYSIIASSILFGIGISTTRRSGYSVRVIKD